MEVMFYLWDQGKAHNKKIHQSIVEPKSFQTETKSPVCKRKQK